MFSEDKRQLVHIILFILAFFLKYLARWQAVIMILLLLAITLIVVPKLRMRNYFYRHYESKYSEGAVLYFFILLILAIVFPLYIVAVSWGILALGDGSATLIGRHFKCRELPWNRHKTYVGSISFVIFGALGAYILLRWMLPELDATAAMAAAAKTALLAAIVESLPLKVNDNVSVAVTSAVALYLLKVV
jgi:dolichol kinase